MISLYKVVIDGELPDFNQIVALSKKHFGAYSSTKKAYTEAVAWQVKKLPKLNFINLTCHWYCKNRRKDKDNIAAGVKFILDGLVMAGVLDNDGWKQVGDINHKFYVDKHKPRVELEIEVPK